MAYDDDNRGLGLVHNHPQENLEQRTILVQQEAAEDEPAVPVLLLDQGQKVHVATELLDRYDSRLPAPRRRKGTRRLDRCDSLVAFTNRYKGAQTTAYATDRGVSVVFDDVPAGPDGASWREFKAEYSPEFSEAVRAWLQVHGKTVSQEAFADLLELRFEDLMEKDGFPAPATVLEMARDLQINREGKFQRKLDRASGLVSLEVTSEQTTTSMQVHPRFMIAVPIFEENEEARAIEVRVQLKVSRDKGEAPRFAITLMRLDELRRDAYRDLVTQFEEQTEVPLFWGSAS